MPGPVLRSVAVQLGGGSTDKDHIAGPVCEEEKKDVDEGQHTPMDVDATGEAQPRRGAARACKRGRGESLGQSSPSGSPPTKKRKTQARARAPPVSPQLPSFSNQSSIGCEED